MTTAAEPIVLIAGRRISNLGNVTTPQLAVYRSAKEKGTGAAVIICPGGPVFQNLIQKFCVANDASVGRDINVLGRKTQLTLNVRSPADKRSAEGTYPPGPPRRMQLTVRVQL